LPGRGTTSRNNIKEDSGSVEEIIGGDLQSHKGLVNSGNTSEDLIALDRLITYLLSQPSNPSGSNLDSWRRSLIDNYMALPPISRKPVALAQRLFENKLTFKEKHTNIARKTSNMIASFNSMSQM